MRRLRTSASKPSGQFVEPKIREHRGRMLKNTGDGFLSEFSSVTDAVRCAIEIQRGMLDRERSVPKERRILFRIGINLGDVIFEEQISSAAGLIPGKQRRTASRGRKNER